jgi:hypothetical protein
MKRSIFLLANVSFESYFFLITFFSWSWIPNLRERYSTLLYSICSKQQLINQKMWGWKVSWVSILILNLFRHAPHAVLNHFQYISFMHNGYVRNFVSTVSYCGWVFIALNSQSLRNGECYIFCFRSQKNHPWRIFSLSFSIQDISMFITFRFGRDWEFRAMKTQALERIRSIVIM